MQANIAANASKKRKCQSKAAVKKRMEREKKRWAEELEIMDSFAPDLAGEHGKSRTFEENNATF